MSALMQPAPAAPKPRLHDGRHPLLEGRRVLMVSGGYRAKWALYERARTLGLRLCMLDRAAAWSPAERELFEHFIEVDPAHAAAQPGLALEAVAASGLAFDAVATLVEFAGPLVAALAEALGLPGHPPAAVAATREKARARELCRDAGIPTPAFARIRSAADLDAAAAVGFPAVLKPASGAGSSAVYRVESRSDLRRRYAQAADAARGARDEVSTLVWAGGGEMLLESFLDGEEFDVDCLLSGGALAYAAVVRDLPQPHMIEVGSQMPPNYPEDRQAELVDLAHRALLALGFRDGVFHVELKDTSAGPRIVEVNARLGGGPARDLHERVWGVDLLEQYLLLQLGHPIRPRKAPAPLAYILTSDLPAPRTGTVTRDDFLNHLAAHPHVISAAPRVRAGQRVTGPDAGVPDWLGEIVVRGDSVAHAEAVMAEILAGLELPIRPEAAGGAAARRHSPNSRRRRGRSPALASPEGGAP